VEQALLDEIIRRVVEVARPERIILFGSAARQEIGPDSDLDLLVVKAGVTHRRRLAEQIYLNLFGITVPIDIIVATPEDLETYRDSIGTIIGPALHEGKEIYAA
jgi:predicted nucleotidyltransferase